MVGGDRNASRWVLQGRRPEVTKVMAFGAFVQIAEGIEGLVHVSEISAEKRIHHPQDVLRAGQVE